MFTINDIREKFKHKFLNQDFVIDKSGVKTIEIIGESFIADEPAIFGTVNLDYAQREIEWYESCSLNVNDIPGGAPTIWKQVADKNGFINSNYGYLIWHPNNGMQYHNVLMELVKNPNSRRATMVYTRPEIWSDYNENGRSDFICTNAVTYLIRDNKLHANVQMRSSDLRFGYLNDFHWQKFVLRKLSNDLEIDTGNIYWVATNLHMYEKDFFLVDHYSKTGEINISLKGYKEKYHGS